MRGSNSEAAYFRKRYIVPFYVLRTLVHLIYIAAFALVLTVTVDYASDYTGLSDAIEEAGGAGFYAAVGVMLGVVALTFILDIVCIIKHARATLSYRFFLIVNVIQTTIWTVIFILAMVSPGLTGLNILITVLTYCLFLGLLIYAGIKFHKSRKAARYGGVTYEQAPGPAEVSYYEPYAQQPRGMATAEPARYEPYSNQTGMASPPPAAAPQPMAENRYS